MIKVKIFGLLRMDTGLKELELEGERVKDLYPQILAQAKLAKPGIYLHKARKASC